MLSNKWAVLLLFVIIIFINLFSACDMISQPSTPPSPDINAPTLNTPTNPPAITTTVPLSSTPKIFIKAPLVIDRTFDGREINVNLVKFTGSIYSPDTTVFINNIKADVSNNGSYYAYLDLIPGKNAIEIRTITNQNTTSEKITVTFSPPLVILLDYPHRDSNVDYRKSPITISGTVSDPLAKIEVNNQQVMAGSDQTFATLVQLKEGKNSLKAVAARGTDTDTSGLGLEVLNNGGVSGQPPGFGSEYISRFIFSNPVIELKAGQMTTVDFAFQADKDIPILGSNYNVTITRVSDLKTRDTLPIPLSLNIDINPSNFIIYPKVEYHSVIVIQTSLDLIPADYYFRVFTNSGRVGGIFSFTLSVKK